MGFNLPYMVLPQVFAMCRNHVLPCVESRKEKYAAYLVPAQNNVTIHQCVESEAVSVSYASAPSESAAFHT